MLKKILLALLILMPTLACADILKNYDEVSDYLKKGGEIRAVIDHQQCTPLSATALLGSFTLNDTLEYKMSDGRNVIASSSSHLIHSEKNGLVYNYFRLRMFPDNSAEITSEFIDPKTFAVIRQSTFNCEINRGVQLVVN